MSAVGSFEIATINGRPVRRLSRLLLLTLAVIVITVAARRPRSAASWGSSTSATEITCRGAMRNSPEIAASAKTRNTVGGAVKISGGWAFNRARWPAIGSSRSKNEK